MMAGFVSHFGAGRHMKAGWDLQPLALPLVREP